MSTILDQAFFNSNFKLGIGIRLYENLPTLHFAEIEQLSAIFFVCLIGSANYNFQIWGLDSECAKILIMLY